MPGKTKATDALLKDHLLINKVLENFRLDHPRFPHICRTLHRAVLSHAWFEDEIFMPAVEREPLFFRRFNEEIAEEHRHIDQLITQLRRAPWELERQGKPARVEFWGRDRRFELAACALQLRALLSTHFRKEEDAWFPLAEHVLTEENLIELGDEMKRRQSEVRRFIEI